MSDRTEETKALLRHALLRREASAENDQLQDLFESLCAELAAANATLDRLREAVPKVLPTHMSWKDSLDGARAILYPPETTNDDR